MTVGRVDRLPRRPLAWIWNLTKHHYGVPAGRIGRFPIRPHTFSDESCQTARSTP